MIHGPRSMLHRVRFRVLWRVLLCTMLGALGAAPARAATMEPNGTVVPRDSMNGEVQLFTYFNQAGEAIDYIADSNTKPEVFSPLCGFTAKLVLKQSASSLGVAWYNADPAALAPPPANQLYPVVPAGSPVGTTINGTDIRNLESRLSPVVQAAFNEEN